MITIIAILVAILLPAVGRVRASARSAQSKNNLSQMGKAMKNYEGLGKGNVAHTAWQADLAPYMDDEDEVFVDPAAEGTNSYAMTNKVRQFGFADSEKIAIIESDGEAIVIENLGCTGGTATITGEPAVRHSGTTNALLYGGAVRTFEPATIDLNDASNEPLVVWWLPDREHGEVCGTVVTIDNPNPPPSPSGTEPDSTLNPNPTGPPPEECYVEDEGFPELAGYSIAFSSGVTLPFDPGFIWNPNDAQSRILHVAEDYGTYELWFEDKPLPADWDWDVGVRITRLTGGDIQMCLYFHSYTVFSPTVRDPAGQPVPGLANLVCDPDGLWCATVPGASDAGTTCDSYTTDPIVPLDPPAGVESWWGYNVNGADYIGHNGFEWKSDSAIRSGGNPHAFGNAIAGTTSDTLFQTCAWGDHSFAIPVPAGGRISRDALRGRKLL